MLQVIKKFSKIEQYNYVPDRSIHLATSRPYLNDMICQAKKDICYIVHVVTINHVVFYPKLSKIYP